jgi:hypothetical protein
MDPAPEHLNRIVGDFMPIAEKMGVEDEEWWICFYMYASERLIGEELEGSPSMTLREALWIIYSSVYWGFTTGKQNFSGPAREVTAATFQPFVTNALARHAALASSDVLPALDGFLREDGYNGLVYGFGYNSNYMVQIGDTAPLGIRPATLMGENGQTRANERDILRADYTRPIPQYLKTARVDLEVAVSRNLASYEALVRGTSPQNDLREMWKRGFARGKQNWGRPEALADWTQRFYDLILHGSFLSNFCLEGPALRGVTALITGDQEIGRRVVRANALWVAYWDVAIHVAIAPKVPAPRLVHVQ